MKSDVTLAKERFKSYLLLFFRFGVAIIVPEIMAGIPDKTIIFRKFDLWWPLLTSIFTWAKKWPKWLRTGSLRPVDRRIVRPSSFPSFRVRGGVILPPPHHGEGGWDRHPGAGKRAKRYFYFHVFGTNNVYNYGPITMKFNIHALNRMSNGPAKYHLRT